jgi:hypothetical protein
MNKLTLLVVEPCLLRLCPVYIALQYRRESGNRLMLTRLLTTLEIDQADSSNKVAVDDGVLWRKYRGDVRKKRIIVCGPTTLRDECTGFGLMCIWMLKYNKNKESYDQLCLADQRRRR